MTLGLDQSDIVHPTITDATAAAAVPLTRQERYAARNCGRRFPAKARAWEPSKDRGTRLSC